MKGINRVIIITSILLLLPVCCFPGGDAVAGRVGSVVQQADVYMIHFIQTDGHDELINDCKEIKVEVKHSRVPWFSWLPFIKTEHPTKKETVESIEYLKNANKADQTVYFGFMGYGLVPTDKKCSFRSKGLKIIELQNGNRAVMSFHDQI
jgi:hypothetical protein